MKRLTWDKTDGSWGVNGVDLSTLSPAAYIAMYKLMRLERLAEVPTEDPLDACCERCCGYDDDGRRSECAECPIRALAMQMRLFWSREVT